MAATNTISSRNFSKTSSFRGLDSPEGVKRIVFPDIQAINPIKKYSELNSLSKFAKDEYLKWGIVANLLQGLNKPTDEIS